MSKSIRLHPKYGVNPALVTCFWCGEETGEIALLGDACKDEAPRHITGSYNPCEKCAAKFKLGIHVFEASDDEKHTPTGRYAVITRECIQAWITDPELAADVLKSGRCAVPKAVLDDIFASSPKKPTLQ